MFCPSILNPYTLLIHVYNIYQKKKIHVYNIYLIIFHNYLKGNGIKCTRKADDAFYMLYKACIFHNIKVYNMLISSLSTSDPATDILH